MSRLALAITLVAPSIASNIGCGQQGTAQVGYGQTATWTFTAPYATSVSFTTCRTGGDTVLTVGGRAFDDGAGCGLNERTTPASVAVGTRVTVAVRWYSGRTTGGVILDVTCAGGGASPVPSPTQATAALAFGARVPNVPEVDVVQRVHDYVRPGTAVYARLIAFTGGPTLPAAALPQFAQAGTVARTMTSRAQGKLRKLCDFVNAQMPGYTVRVLEAWSAPPSANPLLAPPSPLSAGRGLRITIVRASDPTAPVPGALGRLAGIAVQAGFDWVTWADPGFVYVSVRPDECQTDIDLVFLIDGSGSMADYFTGELEFVREVIDYFSIGPNQTRVAALTYSDGVSVNFDFNGIQQTYACWGPRALSTSVSSSLPGTAATFQITVPYATSVTFSTCRTTHDTVMMIGAGGDISSRAAIDNDSCGSHGLGESYTATFAAGQVVVVSALFFNTASAGTILIDVQCATSRSPPAGFSDTTPTAAIDKTALLAAVSSIRIHGGFTNTPAALTTGRSLFTEARGARPLEAGIPRVSLLITDGVSNRGCSGTSPTRSCSAATIAAGQALKVDNVKSFAIGAGAINEAELRGVASDPVSDHLFLLSSAADIPTLIDRMSTATCDTPARVPPCGEIVETVDSGAFKYFQPLANGVTENAVLEVTARSGPGVSIYVSGSDPNAGPYHFDVKDDSAAAVKLVTIRRTDLSGPALYVALRGDGTAPTEFIMDVYNDLFPGPTMVVATVPSGTGPGEVVFNPPAPDAQIVGSRTLQYRLSAYSSQFEVDRQTGQIRTLRRLDWSVGATQWALVLVVRAQTGACLKGAIEVRVNIEPPPTQPNSTTRLITMPTDPATMPATTRTETTTTTMFLPLLLICTEQDADDCASGQSCIATASGTACLCGNGFVGENCDTEICSLNPCFNGGVCAASATAAAGFVCACPAGFIEPSCVPRAPLLDDMSISIAVDTAIATVVAVANASGQVGEVAFGLTQSPSSQRRRSNGADGGLLEINSTTGEIVVSSVLSVGVMNFVLTAQNIAGGLESSVTRREIEVDVVAQEAGDGGVDGGGDASSSAETGDKGGMASWLIVVIIVSLLLLCLLFAALVRRRGSDGHHDKAVLGVVNPMYTGADAPLPVPPAMPMPCADGDGIAEAGRLRDGTTVNAAYQSVEVASPATYDTSDLRSTGRLRDGTTVNAAYQSVEVASPATYDMAADRRGAHYDVAKTRLSGSVYTAAEDQAWTAGSAPTAIDAVQVTYVPGSATEPAPWVNYDTAGPSGSPVYDAVDPSTPRAVDNYDNDEQSVSPVYDAADPITIQAAYDEASSAAAPSPPKKGIKKRAERKQSVYDGFGEDAVPAVYDQAADTQLQQDYDVAAEPCGPAYDMAVTSATVYDQASTWRPTSAGGADGAVAVSSPRSAGAQQNKSYQPVEPGGHSYDMAGTTGSADADLPALPGRPAVVIRPVQPGGQPSYDQAAPNPVADLQAVYDDGVGPLTFGQAATYAVSETQADWNCMSLSKAAATARLADEPTGSFVIRSSNKTFAALTVVKPDGTLYHQHIAKTAVGLFKLAKPTIMSSHPTLAALVEHYADPAQIDLPCALVIGQSDA